MRQENISNIFNISPQVEELINFAQYGAVITAPTREGEMDVHIDLLWEGEMLDISKKSAIACNVHDEMSRAEWMKIETLVYAISKIGEDIYKDEDPDRNKALKDKLRIVLGKSSPILVDFLYEMYDSLALERNRQMEDRVNSIKKKNLEKILNLKPL